VIQFLDVVVTAWVVFLEILGFRLPIFAQ